MAEPEGQEMVADLVDEGELGILDNDPLSELFEPVEPAEEKGEKPTEPPSDPADEKGEITEPPSEPEKKVDPVVAPVAESQEVLGLKAALAAERTLRQELQKKEAPAEKEPAAFDWKDPDKTIENLEQNIDQKVQTKFLNMSQAQCQARHEDFGEKYEVFKNMATENPAVLQSMLSAPDPAQYAYDLAKQKMFTDEVGQDPAAYREKIAAEERAKLEVEFKQKKSAKNTTIADLPPSAAGMTDKVPINGVDKEPFDALFPGQIES